MTRYLTLDELVYINEQLPTKEPIHKILKGKQKVRDMTLLEAAVGRPMLSAFGADAYATLSEKAAALLHSIARNHPFIDGNKRTATLAALFMLEVNGLHVNWDAQDALKRIIEIAEGQGDAASFAEWLPVETGEPSLRPDAEADMQMIGRIMRKHGWLLQQLAVR
ncbi:MAG TPA: type II toxin-antitoxin system death-on-curing family toxin [Aggregatilineaceae bacterium]|nr:type II toxin-antitoxin system death-on-curing family toxin [Aggregatilineaceae bacterium]